MTVSRAALVEIATDKVVNVILIDDEGGYTPPEGHHLDPARDFELEPLPPMEPVFTADQRLDAGIAASVETITAARDALKAGSRALTEESFALLQAQVVVIADTLVSMLQAQAVK